MLRSFLTLTLFVSLAFTQGHLADKCGLRTTSTAILKSADPQTRNVPTLDLSHISPSGNFKIHYTLSGTHEVDHDNEVDVPLYVQEVALAADSAYYMLTEVFGFNPPLPDGGRDGDELDIYIREYNGDPYGMTYADGVSSAHPDHVASAYLVIDNNYEESSYATRGLDGMQVTVAHEFFHMVHFGYANPFAFPGEDYTYDVYWYEISSVWFEEMCYPDIDDYHAYVAYNFNQPRLPKITSSAFSCYGHGILGHVLHNELGYRDGKHVMLDIWENLGGVAPTDNLENVLSSTPWNSSLDEILGMYAVYNVFTGSRSLEGQYYSDAEDLAEVRTVRQDLPITFPTAPHQYLVSPMRIAYQEYHTQNALDLYTQGDADSEEGHIFLTFHGEEEGSSLKNPFQGHWNYCEDFGRNDYIILPMANGNRDEDVFFTVEFDGDADLDEEIQTLWPNPHSQASRVLNISVVADDDWDREYRIYNIRGQLLYTHPIAVSKGVREVAISTPDFMYSGVYILQILGGETPLTKKFLVLP